MKKKTTPQPRNYLVKFALFRKAGSHKKSNKAIRRLEKSKKSVSYNVQFNHFVYYKKHSVHSTTDSAVAF